MPGIDADTLFGITEKVVENGNSIDDAEIKSNLISDPIMVEFSESLIPLICDGLKPPAVQESRKRLARENGMLLPMIRFRDSCALAKDQYPGVADGVIPEQIPYIKVEHKLKEKIRAGESIKDLIHIVEELEAEHTI